MNVYGICFILGIVSWTLSEYLLHRFWGHKVKRGIFYREHSKHHFVKDYFAPALYKARAALLVASLCLFVLVPTIGLNLAMCFTISYVAMYLAYERVHYLLHLRGPKNWYLAKMASHHFSHHFEDETLNHGVTSTIWDHVFNTYKKPEREISVPKKFQMVWMEDLKTQDRFGYIYVVTPK